MNSIIPSHLDFSALSLEQMTLLQEEIEKHKIMAKQRMRMAAKNDILRVLENAELTVSDLLFLFPKLARNSSKSRRTSAKSR